MQSMTAVQLAAHLEHSTALLLDVREPWEFEICHIGKSINIPMSQIPAQQQQFENADEIVVICHHGVRSRHVIQFLQHQAIKNLINLEGGVDAWAREVDTEMPLY